MSAKDVELNKFNALDYSTKSQSPFSKNQASKGYEFRIGVPEPNLTNDWWTAFTAISTSDNPLSPNNEGIIDDIPQSGDVHFLGGVFGESESVTRSIVVADDQTIVFPILTFGADNVGWNFSKPKQPAYLGGFPDFPVPYQFPVGDLQILTDVVMDTAKRVSLEVNDTLLISDRNIDQYRRASEEPYTLELPYSDDILGYRSSYPSRWVKPPYTTGVQDGIWVQLDDLPFGENTIKFKGTIDYGNIIVEDYNSNGIIGDTPVEYLLGLLQGTDYSFSLNVTYHVDVLSRSEFNAQLAMW